MTVAIEGGGDAAIIFAITGVECALPQPPTLGNLPWVMPAALLHSSRCRIVWAPVHLFNPDTAK